jgi:hypothetical protein
VHTISLSWCSVPMPVEANLFNIRNSLILRGFQQPGPERLIGLSRKAVAVGLAHFTLAFPVATGHYSRA